jgi:hypothetical protein
MAVEYKKLLSELNKYFFIDSSKSFLECAFTFFYVCKYAYERITPYETFQDETLPFCFKDPVRTAQ